MVYTLNIYKSMSKSQVIIGDRGSYFEVSAVLHPWLFSVMIMQDLSEYKQSVRERPTQGVSSWDVAWKHVAQGQGFMYWYYSRLHTMYTGASRPMRCRHFCEISTYVTMMARLSLERNICDYLIPAEHYWKWMISDTARWKWRPIRLQTINDRDISGWFVDNGLTAEIMD